MKIFSVYGVSDSGKTTTIEMIIKELILRGYTVGSVKDIHYENFAIDQEGTNTYRHKAAGANPVTARGINETDVLFNSRLSLEEILRFYRQDYVVLEGVREPGIPSVLTVSSPDELNRLSPDIFAVSGKISAQLNEYKGVPVINVPIINALTDVPNLVDLIEQKALFY